MMQQRCGNFGNGAWWYWKWQTGSNKEGRNYQNLNN